MLSTTSSTSVEAPPSPESSTAVHTSGPLTEMPPSGRRRRGWLIAAAVAAVAGAAATVAVVDADDDAVEEPVEERVDAVSAETRDLVEFVELDGRLVDANVSPVVAPTDGVVSAIAAQEATVERGASLFAVNGVPTTLFYADVPLYRQLEDGAVGDDVRVLEENLAALGYHTVESDDGDQLDEGFVVDDEFDSATREAVERWQDDVGVPVTGVVSPVDVVVSDGPATVESRVVDLGDRVTAGAAVVELATTSEVSTTHVEHSGDIELLVDDGDVLATGDVVYTVDNTPITVLVGDESIDRELGLGVDPGDDVRMLEEMLASIGYDAGGDLLVDDRFDEDTQQAVENWQEDLGNAFDEAATDVDGEVSPADVFVVPSGTSVGSIVDHGTDVLASGSALWTSASPTVERIVESSIEVSDQERLALGTVIDVEFPGGEIVQGTVTDVADATTIDPMDPDAEATLGIEIELDAVPESVAALNEVDVVVKVVDELAAGVVVVPASALIALGDGSFAVEALTTTGTTLVPVTTGMFSDGWVEVAGVQAGTQVVTP
ncbi:MAG: peptidoglycan-binding protein [Ilumatobacter sp.]